MEISFVGYQFSWKIPSLGQKKIIAGAQPRHLLGICLPPGWWLMDIKVCSINFGPPAESPWTNVVPAQLWLFLVKITPSWHDLINNGYPLIAQKVKDNALIEQFAISRLPISNRGKQLRYVWDHVASVNIESSCVLKEKKADHTHQIKLY